MWEQALRFAGTFEIVIYLVLGLGGIVFIRKFAHAWQELQGAALLLTMAVIEFVIVSFVSPVILKSMPLPTPTLNLLATATTTLPAASIPEAGATQAAATPAPGAPVFLEAPTGGCIPGQIAISIPKNSEEVSGIVSIVGTANIPEFGFYKGVYKRPDEGSWSVISAGNQPQQENKLLEWDTTRLAPGAYQLGLVLTDNKGKAFVPCIVEVRIARPIETLPGP
jgi:hypothetical protein